jgi:hypothetical protein
MRRRLLLVPALALVAFLGSPARSVEAEAPPPSVSLNSALTAGQNLYFNNPQYGIACNWCHGVPGAFTDNEVPPSRASRC